MKDPHVGLVTALLEVLNIVVHDGCFVDAEMIEQALLAHGVTKEQLEYHKK